MSTITLYALPVSGHSHRVELLLRMLDLPYDYVSVDNQRRKIDDFLQLNPWGQVPVLVDGEQVIADSNAIMVYLIKRYAPASHWLPQDAVGAAQTQQWLGKAAGEVRYGPGSARLIKQFGVAEDYSAALAVTQRLLPHLEQHLGSRQFLATAQPTLADLACYSYIAAAPEGGISLQPYPAIRQWLARIEKLPGFFSMPPLPLPDSAQG